MYEGLFVVNKTKRFKGSHLTELGGAPFFFCHPGSWGAPFTSTVIINLYINHMTILWQMAVKSLQEGSAFPHAQYPSIWAQGRAAVTLLPDCPHHRGQPVLLFNLTLLLPSVEAWNVWLEQEEQEEKGIRALLYIVGLLKESKEWIRSD